MTKFISAGKNKHGLRYREHQSRTIGVGRNKRPLRYYAAFFKWQGKTVCDTYGWENEFKGGIDEIELNALRLKMNRKAKTPPFTYKEMIQQRLRDLQEKELAKRQEEIKNRRKFSSIFLEYCAANTHKVSIRDEKSYFRNWIEPDIGEKLLEDIKLLDLERIRKKMKESGKAPRSIGYIKSIVRQVFNHAIAHELYTGPLPTTNFLKKQKLNNKRKRYLTQEEANTLLEEIQKHSLTTYRITLLSMHTGMRFGEIAALRWQHVDQSQGFITVLDPKNQDGRTVHMNDIIKEMFSDMEPGSVDHLVFPSEKGKQMTSISNTFTRAVEKLGLNEGYTDRRMRVVFHTIRHSCASWLANAGVEIQVIAKVLGHKSYAMTMRYSHINDESVKGAMQTLSQQAQAAKVIIMEDTAERKSRK